MKWKEVITPINMNHNVRIVWNTIRKLCNDTTTSNPLCYFQVAHQLLDNGRCTMLSKPKRPIISPSAYLHGTPFQRRRVQKMSGSKLHNNKDDPTGSVHKSRGDIVVCFCFAKVTVWQCV